MANEIHYEAWRAARAVRPRSSMGIAVADVHYLVNTGRMEMPRSIADDLYSVMAKYKVGQERKKAMLEDGIHHLDSKFGMWEG
jgi:hypothetical protein